MSVKSPAKLDRFETEDDAYYNGNTCTARRPLPRPGLVWFSVMVRVLPSGDVIVTGGKVVASARRVISMRPPAKINGSARRLQPEMLALLATWVVATLLMVDPAQPRMTCAFPTVYKNYLARRCCTHCPF
jgi:hypothetical protein